MRIKHFQGYGCVTATKVSKTKVKDEYGDTKTKMVIRVTGEHEWGLERNDMYDAFNWLLKKFDKGVSDYRQICGFTTHDYYSEDGEVCDYTFIY